MNEIYGIIVLILFGIIISRVARSIGTKIGFSKKMKKILKR